MNPKRGVMAGVALLLVAAIAYGAYELGQSNSESHDSQTAVQGIQADTPTELLETYIHEELGISFTFNQTLVSEPLSEQDTQGGFIARLTAQDPPIIISVRQEAGLRAVATLARTDTVSLLKSNVSRSLPNRFPEFEQISTATTSIGGGEAFERVFTYTGPSGETAQQRLLVIVKDDNTAIYIAMQTTQADYGRTDTQYFQPLIDSITL